MKFPSVPLTPPKSWYRLSSKYQEIFFMTPRFRCVWICQDGWRGFKNLISWMFMCKENMFGLLQDICNQRERRIVHILTGQLVHIQKQSQSTLTHYHSVNKSVTKSCDHNSSYAAGQAMMKLSGNYLTLHVIINSNKIFCTKAACASTHYFQYCFYISIF